MKLEPVAGLIFNEEIYPRHKIDAANVRSLIEAFQADQPVPPIVACRKTKIIIDGVHRQHALVRMYGDKAQWYVKWEDFNTDKQRFLRSVELNARHGVRLTQFDRAHCLLIATRFKITEAQLAAGFGVSRESFMSSTRERFATGTCTRTATASAPVAKSVEGEPVPLKRTIRHKSGQVLTAEQVQANEGLAGFPVAFYADQVSKVIQANLLPDDEKTMESLRRLYKLLEPIVR